MKYKIERWWVMQEFMKHLLIWSGTCATTGILFKEPWLFKV